MPKIRKVQRRKSYKVNINRKRLRNKLRKLPAIECKDIKDAWEDKKSTRHNLQDMGLAYDANQVLKIPNFKKEILSEAKRKSSQDSSECNEENHVKYIPTKLHIAMNLEAEAKAPRERNFRLPSQQVHFLTYLMDKYSDDYQSMARDRKNYYQLTWRQIRSKINTFKGVPEQYAEYLLKKGEIILEDPETLAETKKRIAAENVAKYCAPKAKKVKKTPQWLEEDIVEFDTGDKLEDAHAEESGKNETSNSEKKLKLFSEDESEEEDKIRNSKTSHSKLRGSDNGKEKRNSNKVEKIRKVVDVNSKRAKRLEKLESSDSESEEELEGSGDDEAGFVDLNDLSDQELSDDDVLDDGEFVTDSDEESD